MNLQLNPLETPPAGGKLRRILAHAAADLSVLSTTTRAYSDAVSQRRLHAMQKLFDTQISQVHRWIEEISVHLGMSPQKAVACSVQSISAPRINPIVGEGLAVRSLIAELLDVHETLADQLRADAEWCAKRLAATHTRGLLVRIANFHEETAHALRALLLEGPKFGAVPETLQST